MNGPQIGYVILGLAGLLGVLTGAVGLFVLRTEYGETLRRLGELEAWRTRVLERDDRDEA